ncbi:hypothetical protein HUG15_00585 [Salicibibacter cibarius]|uniref:Uncharacterized protein n=1 Tax=Salicibibacter cibarius TaxID=2743000 RepID=A0A7T6YZN1_9BACI|nr:hypothetical protein HUG15_00585 [Salicibibacter cibarius]
MAIPGAMGHSWRPNRERNGSFGAHDWFMTTGSGAEWRFRVPWAVHGDRIESGTAVSGLMTGSWRPDQGRSGDSGCHGPFMATESGAERQFRGS